MQCAIQEPYAQIYEYNTHITATANYLQLDICVIE